MKLQLSAAAAPVLAAQHVSTNAGTELDLVVPFTSPGLTRSALAAASGMGVGLQAAIRIIRVQCVPYPLDLNQSPVYMEFLRQQLATFKAQLPLSSEIRLAREFEQGLKGALREDSIVVLAYRKRPWRTRSERLAATLRKEGRKVLLLAQDLDTGSEYKPEHIYA